MITIRETTVVEFVCDNPNCGNVQYEMLNASTAAGFRLDVIQYNPEGLSVSAEVWACRVRCISAAAKEKINKEWSDLNA